VKGFEDGPCRGVGQSDQWEWRVADEKPGPGGHATRCGGPKEFFIVLNISFFYLLSPDEMKSWARIGFRLPGRVGVDAYFTGRKENALTDLGKVVMCFLYAAKIMVMVARGPLYRRVSQLSCHHHQRHCCCKWSSAIRGGDAAHQEEVQLSGEEAQLAREAA
jgi:hypothetical protein